MYERLNKKLFNPFSNSSLFVWVQKKVCSNDSSLYYLIFFLLFLRDFKSLILIFNPFCFKNMNFRILDLKFYEISFLFSYILMFWFLGNKEGKVKL